MRLRFNELIISIGLSLGIGTLSAQAQFSDPQVGAFVDALRQNAPQPIRNDDELYSDWQIKGENIPRWSRLCIGRELTPTQFEASPTTARSVLICVTRDVLKEEYGKSNGDATLAVRRAASWWMTGDPNQYNRGEIATYTQKVLTSYQQKASTASGGSTGSGSTASGSTPAAARPQSTAYDRYMNAGYAASKQKNYPTALLYFRRALDERPNDSYATQAIRNVETYLNKQGGTPRSAAPGAPAASPTTAPPSPSSSNPTPGTPTTGSMVTMPPNPRPTTAPAATSSTAPSATPAVLTATTSTTLTEKQAVELVNQWLQAKAEIFAPPFDQKQANDLTTGELYASLIKPDGVLSWLKQRQAYYRYGVQKVEAVERFVVSGERATIELRMTEDRTLYLNGTVAPQQTDFSEKQVRYSLEWANGGWKIADYKTIDGSLLERSILNTQTSERR